MHTCNQGLVAGIFFGELPAFPGQSSSAPRESLGPLTPPCPEPSPAQGEMTSQRHFILEWSLEPQVSNFLAIVNLYSGLHIIYT